MNRRLFLPVLIAVCLTGCASLMKTGFSRDAEFARANELMNEKKYSDAVSAYEKIAKESAKTDRGAEALFAAAEARAFYDNPDKNLELALQEFEDFLRSYPDNKQISEARNWRYFLRTVLALRKENERLSRNIEQLKKIDIRHEERRRK